MSNCEQMPVRRAMPGSHIYRCEYCAGLKNPCNRMLRSEHGTFTCTRAAGHSGRHAACGTAKNAHPIVTWNNERGSAS